jgi:hypothetical protein
VKVVPDGALVGFPDGVPVNLLSLSVTPNPVPTGRAVIVTFNAVDSSGAPQPGIVKLNGQSIGTTNTAFSYTFRTTRKRVDGEWEIIYPIVNVSVPNYAEEAVDCGWP